jgi:hypothetical protein
VRAVADEELFDGGPPLGSLKALGIITPTKRHIGRRALVAVVVGWVPLAILAVAEEFMYTDGAARSFFTDVAVHGRFLIALPLLILAEADAIGRLGEIARHFSSAGLVRDIDRERYDNVIDSTRRLLDSKGATLGIFLLAYALVSLLIVNVSGVDVPAWHRRAGSSIVGLSPAGWWHYGISVPLLLLMFFGWSWRLLLWWRFLVVVARMNLRLIPAHPDGTGGLKFVSESIRGYWLLALAMGVIVAGREMNLVLNTGGAPFEFRNAAISVAVFVVVVAAGPLVAFAPKLRQLKRRGTFQYGALGSEVGADFERRWLDKTTRPEANSLKTGEFSAMTDLYQIVANVYEVRPLPFGWRDLISPVVGALLPFVPVALMAVPLKDILGALTKLLL